MVYRDSRIRSTLLAGLLALCLTGVAACGGSDNGGSASSGKPSYCSKVDALKQSVTDLANVKVVQNGTTSLKAAVDKVKANSTAAVDALKSDFPDQTSALKSSISKLEDSVNQLKTSPVAAVQAIPGDVSAVSTAAQNLFDATKSKCG